MNTTARLAFPVTLGLTTTADPQFDDWMKRAQNWLARLTLDDRGRYLAEACSHADLEQRMHDWDAYEQRCVRLRCLG